ncbi:MAG TPA: DUF2087 domain-containing protein [Trebonia sp.]|jgi:hypothetical protein|nr:DUF2087 domain-containing protein [Trebonia sp.]
MSSTETTGRRRAPKPEAVLSVLGQPPHLAVLGSVAARAAAVGAAALPDMAEHTGLSAAAIAKSIRVLRGLQLVTGPDDALTVDYAMFGLVQERIADSSPVMRAARLRPEMKGYVQDGLITTILSTERFAWFVFDCLPDFGKVTEPELNAHLKAVCADFAAARRLLIDFGLLERDEDGQRYWKTGSGPQS